METCMGKSKKYVFQGRSETICDVLLHMNFVVFQGGISRENSMKAHEIYDKLVNGVSLALHTRMIAGDTSRVPMMRRNVRVLAPCRFGLNRAHFLSCQSKMIQRNAGKILSFVLPLPSTRPILIMCRSTASRRIIS